MRLTPWWALAGGVALYLQRRSTRKPRDCVTEASSVQDESGPSYEFQPIGVAHSCYKALCGTPRQGLVFDTSRAEIRLSPGVCPSALDGLEEYSHCWVQFVFHHNTNAGKPERLLQANKNGPGAKWLGITSKVCPPWHPDASAKVGIFACRSPHRYNPIGMSVGRLVHVDKKRKRVVLAGLDLVDGTPVLDIKPYVRHFDSQPTASCPEWVDSAESATKLSVTWADAALKEVRGGSKRCKRLQVPFDNTAQFEEGLSDTLSLDIRSRFQKKKHSGTATFHGTVRFCGYLIRYDLHQNKVSPCVEITAAEPIEDWRRELNTKDS